MCEQYCWHCNGSERANNLSDIMEKSAIRSCVLLATNEFKKKYKPDASVLNTLHDRARSIRLQGDKLIYGTKV